MALSSFHLWELSASRVKVVLPVAGGGGTLECTPPWAAGPGTAQPSASPRFSGKAARPPPAPHRRPLPPPAPHRRPLSGRRFWQKLLSQIVRSVAFTQSRLVTVFSLSVNRK